VLLEVARLKSASHNNFHDAREKFFLTVSYTLLVIILEGIETALHKKEVLAILFRPSSHMFHPDRPLNTLIGRRVSVALLCTTPRMEGKMIGSTSQFTPQRAKEHQGHINKTTSQHIINWSSTFCLIKGGGWQGKIR